MTTPKVYDLQAKYAAQARKPFVFRWADRTWTLPHIAELDYELQAQIEMWDASDGSLAKINEFFVQIFGEEQAAEWAKVNKPIGMLPMLFNDWLAHSGSEPGESPASDGSSKSTGAKSRRTSTGSTTSGSPKRSSAAKAPAKRAPRKAAPAASPPASSST